MHRLHNAHTHTHVNVHLHLHKILLNYWLAISCRRTTTSSVDDRQWTMDRFKAPTDLPYARECLPYAVCASEFAFNACFISCFCLIHSFGHVLSFCSLSSSSQFNSVDNGVNANRIRSHFKPFFSFLSKTNVKKSTDTNSTRQRNTMTTSTIRNDRRWSRFTNLSIENGCAKEWTTTAHHSVR